MKQSKNELGWADFRVTDYAPIERWWEVIMSAYLLVSLHSVEDSHSNPEAGDNLPPSEVTEFTKHAWWNEAKGWKNLLNNLRLVLQPFIFFNLVQPWLKVFSIPQLADGFAQLMAIMNQFPGAIPKPHVIATKYFSSA